MTQGEQREGAGGTEELEETAGLGGDCVPRLETERRKGTLHPGVEIFSELLSPECGPAKSTADCTQEQYVNTVNHRVWGCG